MEIALKKFIRMGKTIASLSELEAEWGYLISRARVKYRHLSSIKALITTLRYEFETFLILFNIVKNVCSIIIFHIPNAIFRLHILKYKT